MKLLFLSLLILTTLASQAQNIILEFNANHTCTQVNLDSIWIENLTQGGKMVLYYPDNTANLIITDIGDFEPEPEHLYVSQNYPNPFSALTYIDVFLATPDAVSLNAFDLKGRSVARYEDVLEEGMHRFSFSAGAEKTYILTVTSGKQIKNRIMLQMGTAGTAASEISYLGAGIDDIPKDAPKSSDFNFTPGDELRFTGYVTDADGDVDYGVIYDAPEASTAYLFDIANTPPDQPSEISGENNVPMNATDLVYAVEAVEGLVYLWSVPDGWEITDGQGNHAITVNAASEGGEISVNAENNCGLSEASVFSVSVYYDSEPGTVTDIDGNVYQTVIIGEQEWMAENLRVTKYNNGDAIPTDLDNTEWGNTTEGAYAIYNNNNDMLEAYGKLYNWYAVDDDRGLCPDGWSVPSDADWTVLVEYLIAQGYPNEWNPNGAGNALKSCRQVGHPDGGDCNTSEHPRWNSHSTHSGFNEFGFSALPGGLRWDNGSFILFGNNGYWWSSNELSSTNSWYRSILHGNGVVARLDDNKTYGFSLRCVRNLSEHTTYYNLHLELHPETAGVVTGAGDYEEAEVVEISAVANEGWEFINWIGDTDHIDDPTSPSTTVTMPAGNIMLTAYFHVEDLDIIYGDGVTDIDGNEYVTVFIGEQEWMAENLRATKYNNGDDIPTGLSDSDWSDTTSGAYAIYDDDVDMLEAYGALYNWHAVDDSRGLCPTGWSVPSDADWLQLFYYLTEQGFLNHDETNGIGNVLKSCRQENSPLGDECDTSEHPRWDSHGTHYGIDVFGFSGLPGGSRVGNSGHFGSVGSFGRYWSATEFSGTNAWGYSLGSAIGWFARSRFLIKTSGFSIRCIKYETGEPSLYNLELEVYPENSGTVTGAGEYQAGSRVSIAATANTGWEFVSWTGDTDYIHDPSSAITNVLIRFSDVTLTANFQEIEDPEQGTVTDIDGNVYQTVIIGEQEWMAENLRVTRYNNEEDIPTGLNNSDWQNTTSGAYAIYPHWNIPGLISDEEVLFAYGALYNWYAVDDSRGLCPAGWSVPSYDDWNQLVDYVVAQGYTNVPQDPNGAGNALKSCRQVGSPFEGCNISAHPRWHSDGTHHGFDEFGFSALPGGYRVTQGYFMRIGFDAIWWTSSEWQTAAAYGRDLSSSFGSMALRITSKPDGYSIRCVRDLDE